MKAFAKRVIADVPDSILNNYSPTVPVMFCNSFVDMLHVCGHSTYEFVWHFSKRLLFWIAFWACVLVWTGFTVFLEIILGVVVHRSLSESVLGVFLVTIPDCDFWMLHVHMQGTLLRFPRVTWLIVLNNQWMWPCEMFTVFSSDWGHVATCWRHWLCHFGYTTLESCSNRFYSMCLCLIKLLFHGIGVL